MKIPRPSTIYDLRFTIGKRSDKPVSLAVPDSRAAIIGDHPSSIAHRKSQDGIALVITLIMLAITLVMAVAFLALAKRERGSVSTQTDTTVARLAADSGQAHATAQIIANILTGTLNGGSSNAFNPHLLVSTNYIYPFGFDPNSGNPTNVNYAFLISRGPFTTADQRSQNISNLWYLARAPVFVPLGQPATNYDFRYYLDLNQNGRFDTNGWLPVMSGITAFPYYDLNGNPVATYSPPNIASNFCVGDPEWIGVLEHPDQPHGPNNHFTSRYAFIAVPVGNTLDINYVHNQAQNGTATTTGNDGFMRNQGVGSWEINLAAFLADLNTNKWGQAVGSGATFPPLAGNSYLYEEPGGFNRGVAFEDARALLAYRYSRNTLPFAINVLGNAGFYFPIDGIDAFSAGSLQTTLNTNADTFLINPTRTSWSGADNTNHYFTPGDLLDVSKTATIVSAPALALKNDFSDRLLQLGTSNDTYNAYTYYRMLDALGTDSTPEDGKLNLNYSNAVVVYSNVNGTDVPRSISIIPGAETNMVPWTPQNFFNAAADQMLRLYSANWFQSNPSNFLITYYGYLPRGHIDATGLGVTNFPNFGVTNQIPAFGITNIPVLINSNFVYSPAINRLLQLAANLYDATINGPLIGQNLNLPHVFRPIFEHDSVGNVFIVGYTNLYSGNGPNTVSGPADPQLAPPHPVSDLPLFNAAYTPIHDAAGLVNVYGVPWIIGAKKGLPNFNQFYMLNQAQVTRRLEITRTSSDPATAVYTTNEAYTIGVSNSLGVSFWNSYSNSYPRPVSVYASDVVSMSMTNRFSTWAYQTNFTTGGLAPGAAVTINPWQGSRWINPPPYTSNNTNSFINANWGFVFLSPLSYNFSSHLFDPNPFDLLFFPTTENLPQFGLLITNYLQTYILDGNNVIDYVQLRDPISVGGLNQGLADPDYVTTKPLLLQWSTNLIPSSSVTPWGVQNQLILSGNPPPKTPTTSLPYGGAWSTAPTPMGDTSHAAEAAFFEGFFVPSFQYNEQTYQNNQLSIQAPYTPSRTVYSSFLLQANDPLVHYLSSDLNSQSNAVANWANNLKFSNGIWYNSDDSIIQPLPQPPINPLKGRYQPWGSANTQMTGFGNKVDANTYNLAYKDPLVWTPDFWDFPTNLYPTVGWIGRVHRGTPWQTIYMKSTNVLGDAYNGANGIYTWAQWTGDIQTNMNQFFDANNSAPMQDFLLFDLFTTRFNDNAARGTLPVNQTQLAAWSAVLSGMVALTNNAPAATVGMPLAYTNLILNPAGFVNGALPEGLRPLMWQIVNGTNGINATRVNTNLFPSQSFTHAGDILAVPALSMKSPFINPGGTTIGTRQFQYGINDELYEWLPQQMMGLVRASEPRYVVYCFGQTLRPAPGGTVLSGSYFQLVTNYQVVAESAVRAVIRVDGAATPTPHAVVESYNVLPPN